MSRLFTCDGCGVATGEPEQFSGPALEITRINGRNGGTMPGVDRPWHLCDNCGMLIGKLIKEMKRAEPGAPLRTFLEKFRK